MELKLDRNYDTVYQSCQRLISAIVHIMNDDARRMFMFGIAIEGTRMTLWYFSRSHSMKAKSFDFTTQFPTLVDVLISLMFADDKDLGFDPNIALTSRTNRQFIYTVNSESGPRRFKTTHSISENRALSVAGRMTRVFRVVELEGQKNEPKKGAKPMVLKDVWLDEKSKNEMEIQAALFADIKEFANNRDWKTDPRLEGFQDEEHLETMKAFGELFEGERYKDLFLVIQDGSTGEASKPLAPSAWPPQASVFFSATDTPRLDVAYPSTQCLIEPTSNTARDRQIRPESKVDEALYRDHAPKRRSFLIFDNECTRVYCLPTIGDVSTVLRDCIIALRLMFCVGWVHRDISCNNIMAVRDPQTQQWKLKLADLEYSKTFGRNQAASDPKTGTPFFMPCEILRRKYFGTLEEDEDELFTALTDSDNESCEEHLLHNYLHDLEATFWTGLWIITSRSRLDAFESPIKKALTACLLPQLQDVAVIFELVRKSLYRCARFLGKNKAWSTSEGNRAYSRVHRHLADAFGQFADPGGKWAAVPLRQPPASSSPRSMGNSIIEKEPKQPRTSQDPDGEYIPKSEEEDQEEEGGKKEGKKASKTKLTKKAQEQTHHLRRVSPRNPHGQSGGPASTQATGRKRSHRADEQAHEGGSEESSSKSKRVKSNGGGRASASAPSGASTSARRSRRTPIGSKARN
ncbi:hypothetical protein MD484_g1297, partial [Candolleomyces efflorescens]